MRKLLVQPTAMLLLTMLIAPLARADSIQDVAKELKADSVLNFRYGVATDLASNILTAQTLVDYASPTSLELSIEAVLRAIWIEKTYNGARYVGFIDYTPGPWWQSELAIDPNATIGITPASINFGEVQVQSPVGTPEPATFILLLSGLAGLIVAQRKKVA